MVSRPVKHILFENLDFACNEPFIMLDINAGIEGDVETAFIPYDPEVTSRGPLID